MYDICNVFAELSFTIFSYYENFDFNNEKCRHVKTEKGYNPNNYMATPFNC